MAGVRVGKTVSRRVLGVMTDFAYLMDAYREDLVALEDIAMRLAATPVWPYRHEAPGGRGAGDDGRGERPPADSEEGV